MKSMKLVVLASMVGLILIGILIVLDVIPMDLGGQAMQKSLAVVLMVGGGAGLGFVLMGGQKSPQPTSTNVSSEDPNRGPKF
ncbi:MAG: hypothetical protein AB7F86_15450 [Bdellovibrionales bacterium]